MVLATDEELFEDDPVDYVRRDLEGGDSDTRRRSASDFVRGLMDYFERNVTLIVNDYINHYLADYAKNPSANWRSKDTALFLFSAIAIKSSTAKGGVTSTNLLVDVCQFWSGNALEEFSKRAAHTVLKADYIRYIYVFRNQVRAHISVVEGLMVVDEGTIEDDYAVLGGISGDGGLCRVYLCCGDFRSIAFAETG